MMSCGTSSRYGSSLLLKTADFSIQGDLFIEKAFFIQQAFFIHKALAFRSMRDFLSRPGEEAFVGGLLCGLFKRSQHGVATRHGSVERLLGGLLARKCCF